MNRKSDYDPQEVVAGLNSELQAVREQLRKTEDLAAELERVDRVTIVGLERQLAESQAQNKTPKEFFCLNCEMERQSYLYFTFLFLGMLAGLLRRGHSWPFEIVAAWTLAGSLLSGFVTARWRWEQFKQRNAWRSLTDNTIYRKAQGWWNKWR